MSGACPARGRLAAVSGREPHAAYTRLMRRWVCVIALLFGFSGEGYAYNSRPRIPVAIVRTLPAGTRGSGLVPTLAWWRH